MEGISRPNDHARLTYDGMAAIYDVFTSDHNYELWLSHLLPAAGALGISGRCLLDVGCGTGKSFLPLLDRGWEITGCDISAAMLAEARSKVGDIVRLELADARCLPRLGRFDLILALDDVVNYFLEPDELLAAFQGMQRNLASDGLLLFDVNTLTSYRTFFADESMVEVEGERFRWSGLTSPEAEPGVLAEAKLEGSRAGVQVLHRQRHHPQIAVARALEAAGLECLAVYGHSEDAVLQQPLDELFHTKAIYIAKERRR